MKKIVIMVSLMFAGSNAVLAEVSTKCGGVFSVQATETAVHITLDIPGGYIASIHKSLNPNLYDTAKNLVGSVKNDKLQACLSLENNGIETSWQSLTVVPSSEE